MYLLIPNIRLNGYFVTSQSTPLEIVEALDRLGANIRLARLRCRLSQEDLAQACGITRKTLYTLERGAPGVSITTVFFVLWKLGLLQTSGALADPETDEHGRILEAARRPKRARQQVAADNDF
jgi:DNA-binding XRE family transcriptional regulator